MSELTELDPAAAHDWIARWDRQQEVYLPDREERFTALIDAVEVARGDRSEHRAEVGGGGSERLRLRGRDHRPAAGRLEQRVEPGRELRSGGRRVRPAAVLARREQVYQRNRHPDDRIGVTVEVHLTSYSLSF